MRKSSLTLAAVALAFVMACGAALPLFATGLGALGLLGWRRKKKAAALNIVEGILLRVAANLGGLEMKASIGRQFAAGVLAICFSVEAVHASTVFDLAGTFEDGSTISGTISIDVTTGHADGAHVTYLGVRMRAS
jgi:hypothetical protein